MVPPKHPRARVERIEVPDGKCRVVGHEWVLSFEGGELVRADRVATRDMATGGQVIGIKPDPKTYREVAYT